MNHYFWKIWLIGWLMWVGCQHALASDIYSHIVLKLPNKLEKDEPWVNIIKTRAEWQVFYDELTADLQGDNEALPEIDFEVFQLIVGGVGVRGTGGNSLQVTGIYEFDNDISIYVLDASPGDHCSAITVIDYPMTAFLIRKTDKPIGFNVHSAKISCAQ